MREEARTKSITDEEVELSLLSGVPLGYAKGNAIMPLRQTNGDIYAAISDDKGLLALLELARKFSLNPKPVWMAEEAVLEAINRYYGQLGSAEEVMGNIKEEDLSSVATEFERPKDLLELTEEAPIIRLLNALLRQAVKERASDIHIEPFEKELEVRLRVDGVLRRVLAPPKIIQDALVSRVKILSNLDIAERRLTQDGRIRLLLGGKDIDVRVSIVPMIHGERVVMRLLDRRSGVIGLDEVGMDPEMKGLFEDMLSRPNGIILVTGPTGSGKTTTLYAALNRIHSEEKNIITIEDPVEYELKGIGQIQINPKIGLTFASGLRSIVRQDPDVIMVGEIRDIETAQIATQASLTGHLVLSTLHTNDSASAIARLLDIGVEPFLVASSLLGVLAQRLVRVNCPYCTSAYKPNGSEAPYLKNFFHEMPERLFRGAGCAKCNNTGYLGRMGIFELLPIGPEARRMITGRADAKEIKEQAMAGGMKNLRDDGLQKVLRGITTPEEVLRVSQKEHADIQV